MNGEAPFDDCSGIDDRIDERCDAFESAWRSGQRPSIDDLIGPDDEPHRNRLFCELLLVELECRRSLGEQPTQEYYVRKYPEFATQIDATSFRYGVKAFSTTPVSGEHTIRAITKQPGGRIGHFELIERLGTGAMGEAWKAWDTRLRRNVTIKLPHGHSLSENELRRFLREGEAAAQLCHPQLSAVHEIGSDGDTFYIVATFVEGENLCEYANKKELQFKEIAEMCAGIGEALQFAHDEGVVHRDLKPANIVVDPNGLPHIIDFGLAKISNAEHELTMNGELLGTPAYMSPEMASGNGATADSKTDVYSLGVILYELLAGRCLFDGNQGSVISKVIACDPTPPRSLRATIPRDLETICLKAIEKVPANRYASARGMAEDLRRFASGLPILARCAGVPEKSWRSIRRHPAIVACTFLLAAAIVAGGMTIASLQRRNLRLAGFRPVRVTTTPSGARIALVPIDPSTNEPSPDPAGIVRPSGTTPLTVDLKAGTYLVEAVLPGGDAPEFAEVYRTVFDSISVSTSVTQANAKSGLDPETCVFGDIKIVPQNEWVKKMVEVRIPEEVRKLHRSLPHWLYVDAKQTTPAELKLDAKCQRLLSVNDAGEPCISYSSAVRWAELNQKRLPSAEEYDAIVASVQFGDARLVDSNAPEKMVDLFDDFPELTTTIKKVSRVGTSEAARALRDRHVLKGFVTSAALSKLLPSVEGALTS